MKLEEGYYGARDAIEKLGMAQTRFHRLVGQGVITSYTPPGKKYKLYPKEVIDYLAKQWDGHAVDATQKSPTPATVIARPEVLPKSEAGEENGAKESEPAPLVPKQAGPCPPHAMQIVRADIHIFYYCPKCSLCAILRFPPPTNFDRSAPPGDPYWQPVKWLKGEVKK